MVTELLRDSLFQFYRFVDTADKRGAVSYFTSQTLAKIAHQLLTALVVMHGCGMVHCDLKPENICLVSASRHLVKIIDFGSAVCSHDVHNSYVQSRWCVRRRTAASTRAL